MSPQIKQEMAANLNCPDLADAYAMGNLMGISSFCKTHWGNQWAPAGQPIEQPSTSQSMVSDDHRNQIMTFDHQLHQQIQQQLSVEQLQLLTQLQVILYHHEALVVEQRKKIELTTSFLFVFYVVVVLCRINKTNLCL